MIYSLTLETAVLLVGVLLVVAHAIALWRPGETQQWLKRFPRSRMAGAILLTIAMVWAWILIRTIDLGEFSNWRNRILIFIPIAALLTWRYVDEFLAARALGMVALLAAEPLLEAAWMRPEWSRLWLVSLAYIWLTVALFWIGMPYTLRDQIAWVTKSKGRWQAAAFAGIGYGVILTLCYLTLRR